MTKGKLSENIETVLRKLPPKPDRLETVRGETYRLMMAWTLGGAEEAAPRQVSKSTAENELRELADLCRDLSKHLRGLSAPALDALIAAGMRPEGLQVSHAEDPRPPGRVELVGCLSRRTKHAGKDVLSFEKLALAAIPKVEHQSEVRGVGGSKWQASSLTDVAGGVYERLTGRAPTATAGGPFVQFLTALFKACGIAEVSGRSQAQAMQKRAAKNDF